MAKLRKTVVEEIAPPAPGERVVLWDAEGKGFGVRVTSAGKRTYVLRYRMGGRTTAQRTFTIGEHGSPWTVDLARRRALDLLAQVRLSVDPAEARDAIRQVAVADAEARAGTMFPLLADRWFRQRVVGGGLGRGAAPCIQRLIQPARSMPVWSVARRDHHSGRTRDHKEVPPRVDYALTPLRRRLSEALATLCAWDLDNMEDVARVFADARSGRRSRLTSKRTG